MYESMMWFLKWKNFFGEIFKTLPADSLINLNCLRQLHFFNKQFSLNILIFTKEKTSTKFAKKNLALFVSTPFLDCQLLSSMHRRYRVYLDREDYQPGQAVGGFVCFQFKKKPEVRARSLLECLKKYYQLKNELKKLANGLLALTR